MPRNKKRVVLSFPTKQIMTAILLVMAGIRLGMSYCGASKEAPDEHKITRISKSHQEHTMSNTTAVKKDVNVVKGFVCAIGKDPWEDPNDLLQHLDSFTEAYKERNKVFERIDTQGNTNKGGNGLFHSFILWATLKNLRPTLVIESGVHLGKTSWLIHKATEEWNPPIVMIDPNKNGWVPPPTGTTNRTTHDFRGGDFQDFAKIDWDTIQGDRSKALIFFDDHMDQLRRLMEAHDRGFLHAMYDDNYMPGVGDMYSVKDACDNEGLIRDVFTEKGKPKRRCDLFHRQCHDLSSEEAMSSFNELHALVDVLWEGPPLTKLYLPYARIVPHIRSGAYEGPGKEWGPIHDRLVIESTKAPLFPDSDSASKKLEMPAQEIEGETDRYVNMAYIKLRP